MIPMWLSWFSRVRVHNYDISHSYEVVSVCGRRDRLFVAMSIGQGISVKGSACVWVCGRGDGLLEGYNNWLRYNCLRGTTIG